MKTMPRPVLRAMRLAVETMLTVIRWWEDRHADHTDYRMGQLTTSLWQASQSLREIVDGEFQPMLRQGSAWDMPEAVVLGPQYQRELLGEAPIPLRVVD